MSDSISKDDPELKKLCNIAFDTLCEKLKIPYKPTQFPEKLKDKSFPLFVTWTTGEDKELRGCIGTFQSNLLVKSLPRFALISSMEDTRFSPVSAKEVPNLNVGVSLLVNFEKANDCYDWEVGTHGIDIDFEVEGNYYSATFLPEVAEEQNWDKKTTLRYLIRKAGFYGKLESIEKNILLKRYQSYKFFLSYDEYKQQQQ